MNYGGKMLQITQNITIVGFSESAEKELSETAKRSGFSIIPTSSGKGGIDPEIYQWIIVTVLVPSLAILGKTALEELAKNSLKGIFAALRKIIQKAKMKIKAEETFGVKIVIKDSTIGRSVELTIPLKGKKETDYVLDRLYDLVRETILDMEFHNLSALRVRFLGIEPDHGGWELVGRTMMGDTIFSRKP